MTEKELQANVIEAAHILGWRVAHFRPALTKHGWRTAVGADGAGFPDLVLTRERVIFAELKVGKNKLSFEQAEWDRALVHAEAEVYVWTEAHWLDGTIPETLTRRAA